MGNIETTREQAANWLTLKHSEQWSSANEQDFRKWLDSSQENFRTFSEMEQIWADLSVLAKDELANKLKTSVSEFSYNTLIQQFRERMQQEWLKFAACLAAPATFILALYVFVSMNSLPGWQEASTSIAQIDDLILEDGSKITLSPTSRIKYRLANNKREVNLLSGQAYFDIAKDADKPFIIQSGAASIIVLGTQFDVRKKHNDVEVSVVEGHVKVGSLIDTDNLELALLDRGPGRVSLFAGDKLTLSHGQQAGDIEHVNLDEVAPWKQGRLTFKNSPLAEVIDEINRYHNGEINIFGSDLAELRVTATFDIKNISAILLALEKMLPIKTVKTQDNDLLIVRKAY